MPLPRSLYVRYGDRYGVVQCRAVSRGAERCPHGARTVSGPYSSPYVRWSPHGARSAPGTWLAPLWFQLRDWLLAYTRAKSEWYGNAGARVCWHPQSHALTAALCFYSA